MITYITSQWLHLFVKFFVKQLICENIFYSGEDDASPDKNAKSVTINSVPDRGKVESQSGFLLCDVILFIPFVHMFERNVLH